MAPRAWILRSPIQVLDCEDHPYLESARAVLGGSELQLSYSRARETADGKPEFKVFLDGELAFELGDASPSAGWFKLCRDQGFDPDEGATTKIYLRLVVQHEFLPCQRLPEAGFRSLPLHGAHIHTLLKEFIVVTPAILGVVHGGVGALE